MRERGDKGGRIRTALPLVFFPRATAQASVPLPSTWSTYLQMRQGFLPSDFSGASVSPQMLPRLAPPFLCPQKIRKKE